MLTTNDDLGHAALRESDRAIPAIKPEMVSITSDLYSNMARRVSMISMDSSHNVPRKIRHPAQELACPTLCGRTGTHREQVNYLVGTDGSAK